MEELELDDEHIARNDDVDNAVYDCICSLTEQELEWDMEIIHEVTEAIKEALLKTRGLQVRHYSVDTDKDGNQHISDGLECPEDKES